MIDTAVDGVGSREMPRSFKLNCNHCTPIEYHDPDCFPPSNIMEPTTSEGSRVTVVQRYVKRPNAVSLLILVKSW
jgi:hypothetical protein